MSRFDSDSEFYERVVQLIDRMGILLAEMESVVEEAETVDSRDESKLSRDDMITLALKWQWDNMGSEFLFVLGRLNSMRADMSYWDVSE